MKIIRVKLKNSMKDKEYTDFCNMTEEQGIFVSCGSPEDKWVMCKFEDKISYLAWLIAMGLLTEEEKEEVFSFFPSEEEDEENSNKNKGDLK